MSASDIVWLSLMIAWLVLCTIAPMWAVTDAARLANEAWAKSGKDKRIWVVLPPVATLLCGIGGIIAAWNYYKHVRPRVLAQRHPSGPAEF